MAGTAQQAFAEARLGLVDDILHTAGWTRHENGWLPPPAYADAIRILHGRGHWSRKNAIGLMVGADETTTGKEG